MSNNTTEFWIIFQYLCNISFNVIISTSVGELWQARAIRQTAVHLFVLSLWGNGLIRRKKAKIEFYTAKSQVLKINSKAP